MQGAKGSGNARKETRERERERAGSKKREEGERGGRATGLENERRDMPVNGNGLECTRRVNQKKEKSREGRKRGEGKREREREWEKEKEREQACAAGHHNMFWLLRSVRSFLCTSVRLSVVCPGTPTECIAVWPRWRVSDRLSLGLYTLWGSFKRLSVLLLHLLLLRPFLLIAPRISAVFLPPLPPPPFSSSPPSLSSFFFPFFFFCFFFPPHETLLTPVRPLYLTIRRPALILFLSSSCTLRRAVSWKLFSFIFINGPVILLCPYFRSSFS